LIHSLRQEEGQEDPDRLNADFKVLQMPNRPLSQIYDTVEEFAAIVITNVYRSEKGRPGLRAHHVANPDGSDPPLVYPLTNPRNFLSVWRRQLIRLATDLSFLCNKVAAIDCPFNPIFELYAALDRFAPGGRAVVNKSWAGVQ
jgi:hypothetical protein